MQIKRFEARNMTDALRLIKRQLGTEAVILSAKDIRKENRLLGISRKVGVEVTAAVDDGLAPESFPAIAGNASPQPPGGRLAASSARPALLAKFHAGIQDVVPLGRQESPKRTEGTQRDGQRRNSPLVSARRDSGGPEPALASAAGAVDPSCLNGPVPIHQNLVDGGLEILPWPFQNDGPHHIALVGSAGVGKTTTVAKLAARLQHAEGRRVGLISLDREKIGGSEQLRIYADILKIPLVVPHSGSDLKEAFDQLDPCDVVLVDTPAIDGRQGKRFPVFDAQLRQLAQLQTWLVVGADTQIGSMQRSAAHGDDLAPSAIVITKIDLSPDLGAVMHFLSTAARPVVCLTNGPDVPRDLAEASLDLLARLLMQTDRGTADLGQTSAAAGQTMPYGPYWANRSSDIVHRAGCKWIRMINTENVVVFSSFAEALNNQFKPCRYCKPQHQSITGIRNQVKTQRSNTECRERVTLSRSHH
jgi:flagellar biosynthesis protein FlhF